MTPNAAFDTVMPGRAAFVSFWRPDQVERAETLCSFIGYDPGTYSAWQYALKNGLEWDPADQDPKPYYAWLERRLFEPGRWGIIYDVPGAPSQLNDGLLNDNPFGRSRMAPVWHMNTPLPRLAKMIDRYDRVCLGWVGEFDEILNRIRPETKKVGCDAYRRRMDEVSALFGNRWPTIHMLRGVAVARDYPFRQRGQQQPRTERAPLRLGRWHREMARPSSLRRSIGRKAA